jgi:hypothetical protein
MHETEIPYNRVFTHEQSRSERSEHVWLELFDERSELLSRGQCRYAIAFAASKKRAFHFERIK